MNNSLLEIRVFIQSVHLNFTLGFNASLKHNWWKVSWTIGVSFTNSWMAGFSTHLNKASKQFFESWFNAHLMGALNNILMIFFYLWSFKVHFLQLFLPYICAQKFVNMTVIWSSYFVACIQLFAYELKDVNLHEIFLISNYQFF